MDDGRVLQTQICRPCFSLCFQCSEDFGINILPVKVGLPLVLRPHINSPWNVNSWMLFTTRLPWTAVGVFPFYFFRRGLEIATHWLKICWTFLTFLLLIFQLQICFVVQKSEAGYRDASSMISACGIEGSSPLSLQRKGVSFSALTVVMPVTNFLVH